MHFIIHLMIISICGLVVVMYFGKFQRTPQQLILPILLSLIQFQRNQIFPLIFNIWFLPIRF